MNQQQTTTTATDWWADDGPIPMDDLEPTGMVVRQQSQTYAPTQRRSEYAELAELASAAGPRDTRKLLEEARRVGALLGSRAYYDFPAGGGRVTGPSIDLMDALAIVWGRLVQRVEVLEETRDRVHLRGRIVDLLALTATERDYVSAIAPAPGKFASKPDQADRWRVMQIQSASSKAVRGALEHALPVWLVDAALDSARREATQQATGGKPLPEARALAVEALGRLGLDRGTLEVLVEQPVDLWTAEELAQLRALHGRLKSGEVAVEAVIAEAQLKASAAKPAAQQGQQTDRLASLGLGRPQQSAPPPSPSSAPSGGGDPAPASGGEPPATKPSADVGTRAAALRERVRKRLDKGESVWPDELKTAYKGATGTARVGLDALKAAADYGAERGWWVVTTSTSETGEVTGYGLGPVVEEEIRVVPSVPWDKLVGANLEAAVDGLAQRLGDETAGRVWQALGIEDDAETSEADLRRYGRALEAEEQALKAEAGQS